MVCAVCVEACVKGKDQNSSQCSLHEAHIKPKPDKTAKTAIYFKALSLNCLFTGLLIAEPLLSTVSLTNYGYVHLYYLLFLVGNMVMLMFKHQQNQHSSCALGSNK